MDLTWQDFLFGLTGSTIFIVALHFITGLTINNFPHICYMCGLFNRKLKTPIVYIRTTGVLYVSFFKSVAFLPLTH